MATLNPVGVVRDIGSSPHHSRQVHQVVGRITGGGVHTVSVETRLKSVLSAIVVNETDGAVVASAIGASSDIPGTKVVSFDVANGKQYSYVITGLYSLEATSDTTTGNTTIVYNPLRG